MLLQEIKLLNENLQLPPGAEELIHLLCQPYLQAVGNDLTHFLYRGVSESAIERAKPADGVANAYRIKGHYTARDPRSVPIMVHNMFNRSFHLPFRNGIATTGNINHAKHFTAGTPCIVMPVGRFDFCWSPTIADLGSEFTEMGMDELGEEYYDNEDEFINGNTITSAGREYVRKITDQYRTTDLKAAILSGHEVSIYGRQCLLIVPEV